MKCPKCGNSRIITDDNHDINLCDKDTIIVYSIGHCVDCNAFLSWKQNFKKVEDFGLTVVE